MQHFNSKLGAEYWKELQQVKIQKPFHLLGESAFADTYGMFNSFMKNALHALFLFL